MITNNMYSGTITEFLNMGGGEIMLILAVVLLLFGGKKLPELARGLGKGIKDFKDASEGVKREIHRNINAMDIDDELKKDEAPASSYTAAASAPVTEEPVVYPAPEGAVPVDMSRSTVQEGDALTEDPSAPATAEHTTETEPQKNNI